MNTKGVHWLEITFFQQTELTNSVASCDDCCCCCCCWWWGWIEEEVADAVWSWLSVSLLTWNEPTLNSHYKSLAELRPTHQLAWRSVKLVTEHWLWHLLAIDIDSIILTSCKDKNRLSTIKGLITWTNHKKWNHRRRTDPQSSSHWCVLCTCEEPVLSLRSTASAHYRSTWHCTKVTDIYYTCTHTCTASKWTHVRWNDFFVVDELDIGYSFTMSLPLKQLLLWIA